MEWTYAIMLVVIYSIIYFENFSKTTAEEFLDHFTGRFKQISQT